MNKKDIKKILMEYFSKDVFGHYRPLFVEDCDMWDEMFKELIGDE